MKKTIYKKVVYGTGEIGCRDGDRTSAKFSYPQAIALDDEDSIFVVDTINYKIRKIDTHGLVTTFAGSGLCGTLDSPDKLQCQFNGPSSIYIDKKSTGGGGTGDIYIGDRCTVKRINDDGVQTVAGGTARGMADGNVLHAKFNSITGIAMDNLRNLILVDHNNNRVRKIENGVVSTIAGDGTRGCQRQGGDRSALKFNAPFSVVVDGAGNFYVSDCDNHQIVKIDASGYVSTVAGSGWGFSDGVDDPKFNYPKQLAIDSYNNIFVADRFNCAIRKIDLSSGKVSTIYGKRTQELLKWPYGVAVKKNGNIVIADTDHHRIVELIEEATILSANWPSTHCALPVSTKAQVEALLMALFRILPVPKEVSILFVRKMILIDLRYFY